MKYVSEEAPEYSDTVHKTLMIPFQKQEKSVMCFITKDEFKSMIDCCDTSTAIGSRDKLMLLLLYNTGARVSELLGIRRSDVVGLDNVSIHISNFTAKEEKRELFPYGNQQQHILKNMSIQTKFKRMNMFLSTRMEIILPVRV